MAETTTAVAGAAELPGCLFRSRGLSGAFSWSLLPLQAAFPGPAQGTACPHWACELGVQVRMHQNGPAGVFRKAAIIVVAIEKMKRPSPTSLFTDRDLMDILNAVLGTVRSTTREAPPWAQELLGEFPGRALVGGAGPKEATPRHPTSRWRPGGRSRRTGAALSACCSSRPIREAVALASISSKSSHTSSQASGFCLFKHTKLEDRLPFSCLKCNPCL